MCGILFKVVLCVGVLAVVAHATGHGGHSNTHRKQDAWGNYEFGYDITDPWGAKNYRKESGDGWGNKWGSYGIRDSDGRLRIVEYVADGHGFRAKIKTNEPGTSNKDSAAAIYNGPDNHGYSHSVVKSGSVPPHFNHGPSYKHEGKHDDGHYDHGHGHSDGHGLGHHGGYDKVIHHAPIVHHGGDHYDGHHNVGHHDGGHHDGGHHDGGHHDGGHHHDAWSHEYKHAPVMPVSYKHKEADHYPVHHHGPSHHESGWGSSADHGGYEGGYGGGDLAGYGNRYSLRYLHHKK